jgi:hypothetical protein
MTAAAPPLISDPAAHAVRSRELGSALLWTTQPVAIGLAAASVPPLLQATIATTSALLLVWLWTRWHNVAVFAQDDTLAPGAWLGLLFSLRLGLLYVAIAQVQAPLAVVLAFGVLVAMQGGYALVSRGPRRTILIGLLLAIMALLGGLLLARGWAAACAMGAGLVWAAEARLTRDARLVHCGGEKFLFYQLIGAAVTLPVASVAAGENWLLAPSSVGWAALTVQVAVGGLVLPLLWFAPGAQHRPRPLAALARIAPVATLALQTWIVAWPGAPIAAASVLLSLAAWLTRRPG